MACGIYQWVNRINRKRYIGSGVDIERRRTSHIYRLRCGTHVNDHFQSAWNQYGEDQFSFEILRECDPDDLLMWEQVYVDCYDPADLYNLNLEVARSPAYSEQARRKLSEAGKTRVFTAETRRKMSEKAKNRSEETRRRMSEAKRNMSDETRRRISQANKGRELTAETRRKMSEAKRNISDDTRRKLSEAARNISDETRRKMSESGKRRSNKERS